MALSSVSFPLPLECLHIPLLQLQSSMLYVVYDDRGNIYQAERYIYGTYMMLSLIVIEDK